MMWRRIAGMVLALPLGMWTCQVFAQNAQEQAQGMRHDRVKMFATKLALNDQQKEQLRKICTEFDDKVSRLDHQIWSLVHHEHDAILKVLTDEQRAKVPTALREEREKELQKIAGTLGLNDAEAQRIKEICEKFEPKFHDLAQQQGQDAFRKMHELREEAFATIGKELTEEQRAKLPGIIREEIHAWHNPATRGEHLRTVGDKLNLTDDQRNQIKQIMTSFAQKFEQPLNELRQVFQQERTTVDNVLTEEQRTKLRQLMKNNGEGSSK